MVVRSVVIVVVFVLIELDAVLLRERCVLIVLSALLVTSAAESQIERTGTGLLELARFFEAAVTTLLHDRAPEPRELTVRRVYPVSRRSDVLR